MQKEQVCFRGMRSRQKTSAKRRTLPTCSQQKNVCKNTVEFLVVQFENHCSKSLWKMDYEKIFLQCRYPEFRYLYADLVTTNLLLKT